MRPIHGLLICTLAILSGRESLAGVIDFETFPGGSSILDSTPLTNQFSGLTFVNATVISAGVSLDESEFPPYSGVNVVFDDGGPITVSFDGPVLSVGGYFNYTVPLTLVAFDSLGGEVATVTSEFSDNLALSGDSGSSPNEWLDVTFLGGISSVSITGDPDGGSFTLDNLTTSTADAPEPQPFLLIFGGVAFLCALRKKSSFNSVG